MTRAPIIKDAQIGTCAGLAFIVAGAVLLYDAHERRGRQRPFWLRLFGGWV
jgi:hypothetical protein